MNDFKGKKVLIFGLGLNQGGVGSAKFFAKNGAKVKVTDLKSEESLKPSLDELKEFSDIEYTLGEHKNEDIDWADIIIRNPSIKNGNPFLVYALKKDKRVETDFSIFLGFANQKKIIAITGTKGKSTTASLIFECLKASGKEVVFAGNIGKSILDVIPYLEKDPWVVVEISSFQLQALKDKNFAPYIAVITNIFPDHLNWHASMDEYINAKKIIAQNQTKDDFLIITKDLFNDLKGKKIYFSKNDLPKDFKPELIGEHNLENIAAAYHVGKVFNIESNLLLKTLASFMGVPFRMEKILEWNGFTIYNDTTATNPVATVQALRVFGDKTILICGGMNKGMDYKELSETIDQTCKAVYFTEGDSVDEIIHHMNEKPIIEGRFDNLENLLKKLKADITSNTYFKEGDVILFSPGATSLNLFQNEFDRGRKFNEAVRKVLNDKQN